MVKLDEINNKEGTKVRLEFGSRINIRIQREDTARDTARNESECPLSVMSRYLFFSFISLDLPFFLLYCYKFFCSFLLLVVPIKLKLETWSYLFLFCVCAFIGYILNNKGPNLVYSISVLWLNAKSAKS